MKFILPLFICLPFFAYPQLKPVKSDLKAYGINGHVKSIISTSRYIHSDTLGIPSLDALLYKDTIPSKTIYNFNREGFISEINELLSDQKFKFDKHHRKIEVDWVTFKFISQNYSGPKDTSAKSVLIYKNKLDSRGNMVEQMVTQNGKPFGKALYKFDSTDKIIELDDFGPGDTLYAKETYKYDSVGNIIERRGFDIYSGDSISADVNYFYDEKGNIKEQDDLNSDGSVQAITTMEYSNFDSKGNWRKETMLLNENTKEEIVRIITYY